ncbi:glycosyltransferase family 2 protein [Lacticaseibacillus rhamnosus]|uniref:glycosyltransferase family 2 protein n=1 Tax=Lacticaseibacillus rhamnosus TaxID=47715 RepID=UPI00338E0C5C
MVTKKKYYGRVAVLVATYNGEAYVKQQLDSILSQKNISNFDYQVYVYDDGSTDKTSEILRGYQHSIRMVPKDKNYQGVKSAIYTLLLNVDADYYYFADQDDVWEPNKVEEMQLLWRKLNSNEPGGVYSDLLLVDKENNSLQTTMLGINGWSKGEKRDLSFLLFDPRVTGAAFSINREARNLIVQLPKDEFMKVTMHDSFLALVISAFNNLVFLPKPLVRYRQHGNNQIGAKRSFLQRVDIVHRIRFLKNRLNDILILEQLAPALPGGVSDELKIFSEFAVRRNPLKRLGIVAKYRSYWRNTSKLKLALIILSCIPADNSLRGK